MGIIKKVSIGVLVTVLIITIFLYTSVALKSSKAKKEYKEYVSSHSESDVYVAGMKYPDYKIVDVNGDHIPELLFINSKDFCVEVLTFRDGKLYSMFQESIGKSASLAYRKSEHQVAVIHMHSSGRSMQVYKADKTALKKTKKELIYGDVYRIGYTEDESLRGTTVYLIDKKKVSKESFKQSWNEYTFTDSYWKLK